MGINFKIFDHIKTGILFISKDKKIEYINKTASNIFNKKVGDSCFGLFSLCSQCPIDSYINKPFRIENFDVKVSCCDKTVCHSITSIYENGKFIGVLEEFRDATELINSIEEVKKQKEFAEKILNSVTDAILVIDKKGNVIHYNEKAKNYICRDMNSLEGMNIELILGIKKESLPPEGKREDIEIDTPALGKVKVSFLRVPFENKESEIVSFYVLPECILNTEVKGRIITKNSRFLEILEMAKTVADTSASILIEGETGTGKSKLARWIHSLSSRRDKPFIKINCAAIPETLLESELFGYVKGAFTGANKDKVGKVELAEGGTLFLDEIGDMPLYLQSKLLHLIQEKEFERLGDVKVRKADIRIISATNKNLKQLISKGLFREDLYYRLKVIHLHIPPLRERKEDIPYLINYFVEKFGDLHKRKVKGINPKAMKILLDYDYPGNIRELENIIERAVIICDTDFIEEKHLPEEIKNKEVANKNVNLSEFSNQEQNSNFVFYNGSYKEVLEKERILKVLQETNWNKTKASKILGIHRSTLWRKLKEYNIQ